MMKYKLIESPDFMETLIIYEFSTKDFMSPKRAQQGTFRSAAEKMEYLRCLGINGIWLNGHQLCNNIHGNIWCQYAAVRPDRLDPSLGTEDDFKYLIETAHKNGIRVFVDVITHGVTNDSPIIVEHPDWFIGGTWGMTDYDWYGKHPDLDEWWVNTWVDQVVDYNIDGFRLDVAHYRSDLWALVRKRCVEAGHTIMVMLEHGPSTAGVSDTLQIGERLSDIRDSNPDSRIFSDAAGHFLDRQFNSTEQYNVKISYKDGTEQSSYRHSERFTQSLGLLQLSPAGTYIRHIDDDTYKVGYEDEMFVLRLENVEDKEIEDVVIYDRETYQWHLNKNNAYEVDFLVEIKGAPPSLELHFPLRQQKGQYMSVQLSCHDNGWPGYQFEDAYVAKGSRFVMGYGCLMAPAIPIFMSGEEFNMVFRPVPWASKNASHQLLTCWMNWEDLKKPEKKAMLDDVSEILRVRNDNNQIVKALRMGIPGNVTKLLAKSTCNLPIPYIYIGKDESVIVAGNPHKDKEIELSFDFGSVFDKKSVYVLKVIFGVEKRAVRDTIENLSNEIFKIGKDCSPGGGLLLIKLSK